jgi:hypothetical protein
MLADGAAHARLSPGLHAGTNGVKMGPEWCTDGVRMVFKWGWNVTFSLSPRPHILTFTLLQVRHMGKKTLKKKV